MFAAHFTILTSPGILQAEEIHECAQFQPIPDGPILCGLPVILPVGTGHRALWSYIQSGGTQEENAQGDQ